MAKLDRYVPNRAGVRELLLSKGVAGAVMLAAHKVQDRAESAGQIMEVDSPNDRGVPLAFYTIYTPTINRARARVVADHPGAINAERKHRILGKALLSG